MLTPYDISPPSRTMKFHSYMAGMRCVAANSTNRLRFMVVSPSATNNMASAGALGVRGARGTDAPPVHRGPASVAGDDTSSASRTRILGVSGPVRRPGIVEVEAGTTLRQLLFEVADGLRDRRPCEDVLVAGPSDVLLSPGSFDATVESLEAYSAGAGGLIAIPAGEAPAAFAPEGLTRDR